MKSHLNSILVVAMALYVLAAGSASAQGRYDNCSGQGYITNTITGDHIWGQNDPRSSSTRGTTVTLYGDAASNFDWQKAINYLRSTPGDIGKRVYMWLDCGQWLRIDGSPPFLRPECGGCGSSGGNGGSDAPVGCPPGHTMILGNCVPDN